MPHHMDDPNVAIPPAAESLPSPPSDLPYTSLDPRAIRLWRVSALMGSSIFLGALLAFGVVPVALVAGHGLVAFGGWLLLAAMMGFGIVWYPPRRFAAWGYRLDRRVLEIRSGVWFRVVQLLPLNRLQHVDLQRGPLERAHGLASLVFHTAGTHQATLELPGLDADVAVGLRDRLVLTGGDDAV